MKNFNQFLEGKRDQSGNTERLFDIIKLLMDNGLDKLLSSGFMSIVDKTDWLVYFGTKYGKISKYHDYDNRLEDTLMSFSINNSNKFLIFKIGDDNINNLRVRIGAIPHVNLNERSLMITEIQKNTKLIVEKIMSWIKNSTILSKESKEKLK